MKTILHGPFKDLKYQEPHPYGDSVYNKRYGTYEKEIQELINISIDKKYDNIINIGCGEGYYAVGLALKCPNSNVFAYEIEPKAKEMCKTMAELNGVSNILIKSKKNISDIDFAKDSKNLILCDCEGCESHIFNDYNIMIMKDFDFIIETHDFAYQNITEILINKFKNIGRIFNTINAISDIDKIVKYEVEELKYLSNQERYDIFKENRPDGMKWIYSFN